MKSYMFGRLPVISILLLGLNCFLCQARSFYCMYNIDQHTFRSIQKFNSTCGEKSIAHFNSAIDIDENIIEEISQQSSIDVPADLVGTKWVFNNGYRAERRTIEFSTPNTVKITDEDTNIWVSPEEREPPVVHIAKYYYDKVSDRIVVKKKSNMRLEYVWMQLRFENGQMIDSTNRNVEIQYERVK